MKHNHITLVILLSLLVIACVQAAEPVNPAEIPPQQEQATSDNTPADSVRQPQEQLNTNPNQANPDQIETPPLVDPNAPQLPNWQGPQKYWQPQYHPQVDQRTFMVLNFPYYNDGQDYHVKQWQQFYLYDQWKAVNNDPNDAIIEGTIEVTLDIAQARSDMEKCCDMIHQWRSINESPQTALEIVRAIELTKTTTQIYRRNPDLAVQVIRTVGQIGQVNKHFDLTSRTTTQAILKGNTDKIYIQRMRKQLADLTSYLERLAEQNDAISIELGIGKIDRSKTATPNNRKIDYSHSVIIEEK